ncbi:MAG: substrate-binding domain-containing protein [Spirochaetaceae bacterium]|jgi:ribose transport system substrate-binding protein|nr:substrate-binding domain-containing protein [Spirochaetaceae bacterium]
MKKKIVLGFVLLSAFACVSVWAKPGDEKMQAVFIAGDSVDDYWLQVRSGAEDKAKELSNVDFSFESPKDAANQQQLVEDAITKEVDILMIAPLNTDTLVQSIEKAKTAGIKVIIIDFPVDTNNYDVFLSGNNGAAARKAADEMAKLIGKKGEIAIINAKSGDVRAMIRENDFKDQIAKKYPRITVVGTQYSDGDKSKALTIAADFITANPDLAGIYTCNGDSTLGAGNAIEEKNKTGTIKLVGFDLTDDTKALIQRNTLNVAMVQNPYQMGLQALQAGVDLVNAKKVKKNIDINARVITKANINSVK